MKKIDMPEYTGIQRDIIGALEMENESKLIQENEIRDLSMELYYSTNIGEPIDHNDFTTIFEEGYKSAQQKSQKLIDQLNINLRKVSEGTARILENRDKKIKKQQAEIEELKKDFKSMELAFDGSQLIIKELEQQIKELNNDLRD